MSSFIPREYSLREQDLIPPDEDDGGTVADERRLRYARFRTLIDVDDLQEIICCRLTDSAQLRALIEDNLGDPQDEPERPRIHLSDAMRLAQEILREVVDAIDEQMSLLDVTVTGR